MLSRLLSEQYLVFDILQPYNIQRSYARDMLLYLLLYSRVPNLQTKTLDFGTADHCRLIFKQTIFVRKKASGCPTITTLAVLVEAKTIYRMQSVE